MGVGAAASEPGTLSLIRHVYPERRARARALGVWAAVSGLALALGPIAGGILVAAGGWRSVFWFNLALGAAAGIVAAVSLDESADPEGRRLDVEGLTLGAAALVAATFAVIEGESVGYRTWWITLLFVAAAALAIAFVLVERRARDPVLKRDILRAPAFAGVNVVAFATNFAVFAVFFFTALYLELVADFSGWDIALQFVSMAAAMAIAGPVAGRWTARTGPRAPMIVGCVVAGGGMFAVDALLSPHASIPALAAALAVVGVGFGAAIVAVSAAVLTLVPAERSGTAASTLNTSRELGGVVGVAVLGAVVNAQLTASLAARLEQLGIPANFRAVVVSAVTHGAVPENAASNPLARGHEALVAKVLDAAEQSFGRGLHLSLLIAAGLLFAGAAVAALTVERGRGTVVGDARAPSSA
jgi:MFS family permease